jgi:hypothetical protein
MNARERFLEVMNFNANVPTVKWEFGYWGETLFWVNPSAHGVQVQVRGAVLRGLCVMTEQNIRGDRETGQIVDAPVEGKFHAPAMSFGYATVAGE